MYANTNKFLKTANLYIPW